MAVPQTQEHKAVSFAAIGGWLPKSGEPKGDREMSLPDPQESWPNIHDPHWGLGLSHLLG